MRIMFRFLLFMSFLLAFHGILNASERKPEIENRSAKQRIKTPDHKYESIYMRHHNFIDFVAGYNGFSRNHLSVGLAWVDQFDISSNAYELAAEFRMVGNSVQALPKIAYRGTSVLFLAIAINVLYDFQADTPILRPEIGFGGPPFTMTYGMNIGITSEIDHIHRFIITTRLHLLHRYPERLYD
jgi:hypothetical protein